ncbi:hypothetical protein AXX17_AT1G13590 [Arabidopsis thaliana]|uniref:Uncharacterized protein n=1 Tax=Arabidopsis thaliana TaxID=3702 RepID=A0A178WJT4_ARATH|nr:hypothetical protein AXX17_AT1G13590 [Arabidopsis thaliana]
MKKENSLSELEHRCQWTAISEKRDTTLFDCFSRRIFPVAEISDTVEPKLEQ